MTTTTEREPRVPLLIWNEKRHTWETPDEKRERERNERYERDRGNVFMFWADAATGNTGKINMEKLLRSTYLGRSQDGGFRYSQDY